MTEEDESDPLNPLYIGPEKLLSLFSENNWGNFCLSYLLTNRDYSGVLGLAWEGKAGEPHKKHTAVGSLTFHHLTPSGKYFFLRVFFLLVDYF